MVTLYYILPCILYTAVELLLTLNTTLYSSCNISFWKKHILYSILCTYSLYTLDTLSLSLYIYTARALSRGSIYLTRIVYIFSMCMIPHTVTSRHVHKHTWISASMPQIPYTPDINTYIHTPPPWPQGGGPLGGEGERYLYVCLSVCIHMNACLYVWYSAIFLHKRGRHIERNSPSHGVGGPGSYVYI